MTFDALMSCVDERRSTLETCASAQHLNSKDFPVAQGTVKWFNNQKGYGFIQPDGGGNDVFVHISAVEQAGLSNLNENQKVSFDVETGRNGKASAVNLKASG
jgi:CspA family cold shock protein